MIIFLLYYSIFILWILIKLKKFLLDRWNFLVLIVILYLKIIGRHFLKLLCCPSVWRINRFFFHVFLSFLGVWRRSQNGAQFKPVESGRYSQILIISISEAICPTYCCLIWCQYFCLMRRLCCAATSLSVFVFVMSTLFLQRLLGTSFRMSDSPGHFNK